MSNIKPFKELCPFKNRSSFKVIVNAIGITHVNSCKKPICQVSVIQIWVKLVR